MNNEQDTQSGLNRINPQRFSFLPHLLGIIVLLVITTACRFTDMIKVAKPDQTPEITTRINPVDQTVMVFVPAGQFKMGRQDTVLKKLNQIHLDAFWIYQTPVTNAQFSAFISATGYTTTAEIVGFSEFWCYLHLCEQGEMYWASPLGYESDLTGIEDYPVVHVSWDDAAAYCAWSGTSLPTDAQWEKAARGSDGRRYPWGDQKVTGEHANFCDIHCAALLDRQIADTDIDDGYRYASPVGNYPAGTSPYGAMDMAGNVWEWVLDFYNNSYYRNPPGENPTGPQSGTQRVLRGGSFLSKSFEIATYSRRALPPDFTDIQTGFRCAIPEAPQIYE